MTPSADLHVIGSRGRVALTAIIDTGFDGYLCLPTQLAVRLGLELVGKELVELADGSQRAELVFAGAVDFLGKILPIHIYLTDSEDALIGTALLAGCRMNIDFSTGKVRLSRK